jgi:type 1 glutamine amidotransferase
MRHLIRALLLLIALAPAAGVAQDKKKYKILYITQSKGFKHGSVDRKKDAPLAPSEISVTEIGQSSGLFEVECTQDASVLTAEKLKDLDAVMFYTTGGLPIKESFPAFEEWLKAGHAMIGVHSSTDTLADFKPYWSLINGSFNDHPWGAGETVTMTVHETSHVVAKPWPAEFQIKDEIYQYRQYDPKAVRVIYSINMAKTKTKRAYHVPVCWVREFGKGRLFYTNLGHNEGTWTNPQFKEHLLTGIRWALKLEEGPAEPNPELQYGEQAKAFAWVTATAMGKNADELAAKAEKAARSDVAWGEKLYWDIDKVRRWDKKKDADGSLLKAEQERLISDIEKK